jgi:hypothetical protein
MNMQLADVARIAGLLNTLCGDDDTLFADMVEGETDLFAIVGRLHQRIASDGELIAGITERQADLAERKRRLTDRTVATKAAIGQFLRAAMIPKIELPEATYSVRDGKSSLKIVDVDAVPEAYCTLVRQPVKAAINEAFADASELPNWLVREAARDVVTARTK